MILRSQESVQLLFLMIVYVYQKKYCELINKFMRWIEKILQKEA